MEAKVLSTLIPNMLCFLSENYRFNTIYRRFYKSFGTITFCFSFEYMLWNKGQCLYEISVGNIPYGYESNVYPCESSPHPCKHTYTQAHTRTHVCPRTHMHAHAHMQPMHTHTHTHARTHTHMHTHAHTRTRTFTGTLGDALPARNSQNHH